jgi:hypothetical protein
MIEYDLTTNKRKFHFLPITRPIIDLPSISARGMSSADLDAAIQAGVERVSGGIDDKVVRQVVRDVPRHIARSSITSAARAQSAGRCTTISIRAGPRSSGRSRVAAPGGDHRSPTRSGSICSAA